MRAARVVRWGLVCGLLIGSFHGCRTADPIIELDELRHRVAQLRSTVESRLVTDALISASGLEGAPIVVGMRTERLRELLTAVATRYLDNVQLDLHPRTAVQEGDEVRVNLGFVNVSAGRWDLKVTIEQLQARLSAGQPEISIEDDG